MKEINRKFETLSGIKIKELYTSEDLKNINEAEKISLPAKYPFTRVIYTNMNSSN